MGIVDDLKGRQPAFQQQQYQDPIVAMEEDFKNRKLKKKGFTFPTYAMVVMLEGMIQRMDAMIEQLEMIAETDESEEGDDEDDEEEGD